MIPQALTPEKPTVERRLSRSEHPAPRTLLAVATSEVDLTAPFGHIEHDPQAIHTVDWRAPGIPRVVGMLFADAFGFFSVSGEPTRVQVVDGRPCLVGALVALDVDTVFDVDAEIELRLVVDRTATASLLVGYDANLTPENKRRIDVTPGDDRWATVTVGLERARFAGRGPRGCDVLLGAPEADFIGNPGDPATLVIAAAEVRVLDRAPMVAADAAIEIALRDERGDPTAARAGLYDATGREVLPSDDAVPVTRYGDSVRHVPLRSLSADESGQEGLRETWPHNNRWAMVIDGSYRVAVPAGTYDLVLTKGPEYRWVERRLTVAAGETCRVEIQLERWIDLPANDWYSGDAHIHIGRDPRADEATLALARAEDVHVANLLQMGNIGAAYFGHAAFGAAGGAEHGDFHVVSGQEDPRTGRRGHTLHLNVAEGVRDPDRYFLYHETFERLRAGGALTGYAHVDSGWFSDDAGLALDVPFGLVDLVEILQAGALHTRQWYDFLNLGYRLVPVAGSDWPYIDMVGSVRNMVHVPEGMRPDRWFEELRAGRTFVTNGPMFTLQVGDAGIGDQADARLGETLRVRATAAQSPDLGPIDQLELVVHGEVVATAAGGGSDGSAELEHALVVERGCWVAARATSRQGTFAHTAPAYVPVGGAIWHAGLADAIVERLRSRMAELLVSEPDPSEDLEPWDSKTTYVERWHALLPELTERVAHANQLYDDLLERIAQNGG
jgi:hypothetical protein